MKSEKSVISLTYERRLIMANTKKTSPEPVSLETRVKKLEKQLEDLVLYINAQVKVNNLGGDAFQADFTK